MEPVPGTPAAPEPAAPVTPSAPVDPAPAPPVAPATPIVPAKTPEEVAAEAEDQEWDKAANETFPELESAKKKGAKDEPAKSTEEGKEKEASSEDSENKKPDEEPGASDDAESKGKTDAPANDEANARAARIAARQSAEQVKAVESDIRTKMFADIPTQVQDAEGNPISTLEDVQNFINPRTGEAFTEEEAGMWLITAQQQLKDNLARVDREVQEIANVNIALKDEADAINDKYGDFLKANPELRDEIWNDFKNTLTIDEQSETITKMPVSLQRFYERALSGREQQVTAPAAPPEPTAPAAPATPTPEEQAATDAQKKADEAKARQQARADRSDIYIPPNDPKAIDPEEAEWAKAAEETFPEHFKK